MRELKIEKNMPIGFMDSGLGGLSVLRAAVKVMPQEDFIYYGDSAHAPYGTKPQEEIKKLTFDVVEQLLEQGIKGLAVACNTATSAAVRALRMEYPNLPIVGIEPAIKPAVSNYKGGRILVMATPMTIKQPKYHKLLDKYSDKAEIVSVACPGLMEFVEQGNLDGDELDTYFEEHLNPYLTDDTETIVLGCTHYPFLKHHIMRFLGDKKISLIDGSLGTANELRRRLNEQNLLKDENGEGTVTIYNSTGRQEMIDLSYKLLQMPEMSMERRENKE